MFQQAISPIRPRSLDGPRHPLHPISQKSNINIMKKNYKLEEKLNWNHAKRVQWSESGEFYFDLPGNMDIMYI